MPDNRGYGNHAGYTPPPPTHLLECVCGGRASVDMGRLTPFIEGLFSTYHDGDGHKVTETINDSYNNLEQGGETE